MTEMTDSELIRLTLKGTRTAFEELIERHQRTVFNVALRMVKGHADAQDVTQTVFLKAYENLHSRRAGHKFFSWIYRIAVNESLSFLQRSRRLQPWVEDDQPATQQTPEEDYREAEMTEKIQSALMLLTIEHRAVIVLKHLHDLSYREIGYILDLPLKTVKSRLYDARQSLKGVMIRQGYFAHG